jgi:hypothetical protein
MLELEMFINLDIAKTGGAAYRVTRSVKRIDTMAGNSEMKVWPKLDRGTDAKKSGLREVRFEAPGGWRPASPWGCRVPVLLLFLLLCVLPVRAALQFDVFLGYDGFVTEGSWFPVVCEVKNDGPTFVASIEVEPGNNAGGAVRSLVVELPTGTLKRVVLPVFCSSRNYASWDVRLRDERGKVRAEQAAINPRRQVAREIPLMGAIPRTAGGTPVIRQTKSSEQDYQPACARMLAPIFPDNPLVLEGLNTLYLSSEKALELGANQVNALRYWLFAGGHLIVGVEQASEVNATGWLRELFPCELKEMATLASHPELQEWLRRGVWPTNFNYNVRKSPGAVAAQRRAQQQGEQAVESNPFTDLPDDLSFESAALQVCGAEVSDGQVEVASGQAPMVVSASRGRGKLTVLLFSPEREPFRSWKNAPTFWAKLAGIPATFYQNNDINRMGGWGCDGIFGALIDSRQVHKLPVGWLLLLLLVYLVVIGPLDQWWLKKIGKPMLTWITFPCYVVVFSLVIYLIGYKLRAGESEWNELHVVDVLPRADHVEMRGRTYSSVYSPANQRYELESKQKCATFRPEYVGGYFGMRNKSDERGSVLQVGDSFKAEVFVPVWVNQLYVSDWWQAAVVPLVFSVETKPDGWQVRVENRTDHKIANSEAVLDNMMYSLGEVPAHETKTFAVNKTRGMQVANYVFNYGQGFQNAVTTRQRAFGGSQSGQLGDPFNSCVAASFLSYLGRQQPGYGNSFVSSPGLDLSAVAQQGQSILFAWAPGYSPVPPNYNFTPRRSHKDTFWRVVQ